MVTWTTKIVKESFLSFRVLEDGASKLKKMAVAIRWCVGIFQAFDVRVNARSSTKAGPIGDHSDFAPFAASSANTRESMEVELAIKWSCQQGFFFAARVLGKLSRLKALQRVRLVEDAGKDECLQSNEYFCDAVCGDIARKTSSPKGHRRLPRTGKLLKGLEAAQLHNRLAEQ